MALLPNTLTPIGSSALVSTIASSLGGRLPSGVTITSVGFSGHPDQISQFSSLDLGLGYTMGSGLLLSTGDSLVARNNNFTNESTDFGRPGDAQLTAFAQTAFPTANSTSDAAVIELTFEVTDPNVKSIRLDLALGSEEYPEFSSSPWVDIATVSKDGVNYALFNGNPSQPFSIIDENTAYSEVFYDNTSGALNIEYDGISDVQSVFIPVEQGTNTIRIGVADTGDGLLDTGLFVLGMEAESYDLSGFYDPLEGTDGIDILTALIALATLFECGFGDDQATGNSGNDAFDMGDGNDLANGEIGDDFFDMGNGNDDCYGGDGSDEAYGEFGDDDMFGGLGDDFLSGDEGEDELSGGSGKDILWGGLGNDILKGGKGADLFFFDGSSKDQVLDFRDSQDDEIGLSGDYFSAVGKKVNKSEFRDGKSAKDDNDFFLYSQKKGKLYYDADADGSGKKVLIADFENGLDLNASDFTLFF